MKPMYKKGGKKKAIMKEAKREKESFMVENKELEFGKVAMGMGGMMKYSMGGAPCPDCKLTQDASGKYKYGSDSTGYTESIDREIAKKKHRSSYPDAYKPSSSIPSSSTPVSKADSTQTPSVPKIKKTGGKKSMEPGGGGRFAAMVSGLKKEGKSEESAKAIAASVGRKKYGKSRFQEMAAAGKQKKMGGKKC